MKKIYLFALILLAAGCAKETDHLQQELNFTLCVPDSQDTKTSLGGKSGSTYPVYWGASDVITLNGTAATSFTRGSGNTTATASFKLTSLSAPYNFLYCGVPGQGNQVSFPSTQNYVAGGFDPAAMPMYASLASRSENVSFNHVGALLRFSFTGDKKIDSVTLTAVDGSKSLSGNFTIGATAGLLNGSLTPASGGASLVYSFDGHKQLSNEPFVFYVAIPAGTYEGGITLDIVDNSSGHMTVKVMDSDATKTIAAGRVREFENVVYSPDKVVNLKQIYDAATFLQFVDAVAGGNKTLNARLTQNASTLNLSSIAANIESIEDYKGVFDGNGKTISGLTKPMFADLQGVVKNLTLNSVIEVSDTVNTSWGIFACQVIPSTEIDDIAGLQNCTAQGSITWTPSYAFVRDSQLGGLVGNNKGGAVTGCTNQAAVTFADSGNTCAGQSSIGGVVGRSQKGGALKTQGDISGCTNSGTVVCDAGFSANIYLGGVLGFQVEKSESIRGCTNGGTVKATGNASTTKALHIGGVIGLGKGSMESCSNLSGGTVTTEACPVGTNLCQGGVVGRMTHPDGTYTSLSNAGTLNVGASGVSNSYIGGVAGRCNEGAVIDGLTNSGTVNCTSSQKGDMNIGGIAGCSKIVLSATNTGNVNVSGLVGKTGKKVCVGGVVGQNEDAVTAGNEGSVALTSGSQTKYDTFVGGIVGRATANVTSCTNSGSVTNACPQSTSGQFIEIGGIVGYGISTAQISNCSNTGNVASTASSAGYLYVGGIVGEIEANLASCTNSGTVSNSGVAATELCLGGVSGVVNGITLTSCGNGGALSVTSESAAIRVGGIAGKVIGSATSTFDTCANGKVVEISNEGTNSDQDHIVVGGIAGRSDAQVLYDSCTNNGLIRLDMTGNNNKAGIRAGGIFGDNTGKDNDCSECVNNADIEAYYQEDATPLMLYSVGGIAGRIEAPSAGQDGSELNTCTNKGYLYVISNRAVMGGIVGQMLGGRIIDCENTNEVRYRYNKSVKGFAVVGGIAGDVWDEAGEITGCTNSGAVTSKSLTGSSTLSNYVGGIAGWIEEDTSCVVSGCENTGAVTCNTCSDSDKGAAIAGGIIGYKESSSTDENNVNRGGVLALAVKSRAAASGGAVGALHHGTVKGCYNYGTIEAGEKSSQWDDSNGKYTVGRAGSIVGFYTTGKTPYADCDGTITKCYVGGAVKSASSGGTLRTITSSNYGDNIVGIGTDPTDCYFAE